MVSIEQIKQLREETGISISACREALEEAQGDVARAKDLLKKWGEKVAEKKQQRTAGEGLVEAYVHSTGKIGSLVEVRCETDFAARSADFKNLCHELALQVASTEGLALTLVEGEGVSEFMEQPYVRDPGKTVKDVINEYVAKVGEHIVVERFARFQL